MSTGLLTGFFTVITGAILFLRFPFPETDFVLRLVRAEAPWLFQTLRWSWIIMLFTTPGFVFAAVFSLVFTFGPGRGRKVRGQLPPFPVSDHLAVVIGELHEPRRVERAEHPSWLIVPERGLFTGIAIFGAIGSGKTSCCIYPYAEQILGFRADDRAVRAGGLVLEVKGDFCHQIREILTKAGRAEDYVEIGLDSEYVYNPLNNDQDAFALAYSIASLLTNLYGRGKEPFWQQAYTNLVKFIILLHKVVDDYCTLFQVYECAINPSKLGEKIREAEQMFARYAANVRRIVIDPLVYVGHDELTSIEWDSRDADMCAPYSDELAGMLDALGAPYSIEEPPPEPADLGHRLDQFEAVKRWFAHDWTRIDTKLRTSIVEGISVFLSLFDENPRVKRIFCPPREAFDPVANADHRFGIPLPPFSELIENGKVLALNFPVAANTAVARTIGTMLKLDFQRAMLQRISVMAANPQKVYRPILFLCDEYQAFATAGEADPSGDEKFFNQSRQSKCIPIVATQSVSSLRSTLPGDNSWRTLMQSFRTRIFLCLSDEFSAKVASDSCGRDGQLTVSHSFSESGHDVKIGMFSGKAQAHKAGLTVNKNVQRQWRPVFEAKKFMELRNAQAIVQAYDGLNPMPPQYCYLKPRYLPRDMSYFAQLDGGLL